MPKVSKKTVIEVGRCDLCGNETAWTGYGILCGEDYEDILTGDVRPCGGTYNLTDKKESEL